MSDGLPCVLRALGNHSQISRAVVAIRVMDVNDNAPEFATEYEAFLCENGKPGQVRRKERPSIKPGCPALSISTSLSLCLAISTSLSLPLSLSSSLSLSV